MLGIPGMAAPVTLVAVAPALIHSDMWWMIGTSLLRSCDSGNPLTLSAATLRSRAS